jgi:hypothetical protein
VSALGTSESVIVHQTAAAVDIVTYQESDVANKSLNPSTNCNTRKQAGAQLGCIVSDGLNGFTGYGTSPQALHSREAETLFLLLLMEDQKDLAVSNDGHSLFYTEDLLIRIGHGSLGSTLSLDECLVCIETWPWGFIRSQ